MPGKSFKFQLNLGADYFCFLYQTKSTHVSLSFLKGLISNPCYFYLWRRQALFGDSIVSTFSQNIWPTYQ